MTPSNPLDVPAPKGPRALALVVGALALPLCAAAIAKGAWSDGRAPFPFIWRDVALVYFLCATPLAWWTSATICRGVRANLAALAAFAIFAFSAITSVEVVREELLAALSSYTFSASALRIATAFGYALSVALLGRVSLGLREESSPPKAPHGPIARVVIGLIALTVVPGIYVQERTRHDCARLGDYLDQGRIGEAQQLAHALLTLDFQVELRGQPLARLTTRIDQEVMKLEELAATPLPADPHSHLQHARHLAMLGRTDQALAALATFDNATLAADAYILRGTIHEARGEWAAALALFQQAKVMCETGPARASNLVAAVTGIAYAQRKGGDYVGAEASYRELLALSPSAETHFLLAQFYEDSQDAGKSQLNARRAIALDPDRYQQDGEKLIRKLSVFQFGCLRALGG